MPLDGKGHNLIPTSDAEVCVHASSVMSASAYAAMGCVACSGAVSEVPVDATSSSTA